MDHLLTAQNLATVAMTLLMAYVLFRSRTPGILKGELEIQRQKSDRLEKENGDLTASNQQKDVEIAQLKERSDLTEIRKGQTAILEIIATNSASVLDNQSRMLSTSAGIEKAMIEMVTTLAAMERRLDRGLVMK